MDRARALDLQRHGLEAWIRATASVSAGGRVLADGGVVAAILPSCPRRSVPNSAIHSGAEGLHGALESLADAYEEAGVTAAAMWTTEADPEAEAVLERSGYALDGEPAAMCAELRGMPLPDIGDLDWDSLASAEQVGRVNDLAYGYPPGEGMAGAIGEPPADLPIRSYRARAGGEVAAVMQTVDVDGDCLVTWVATLPDHRGRGLASRLLAAALGEAADRGLETTSLQASMLGRGVYERLGYELIGTLRLHERRLGSPP